MNRTAFLMALVFLLVACEKQETGLLVDQRDGHEYQTVKIGNQWWMAENLAYMPFVAELKSDAGIWVFGYNGTSHQYALGLPEYSKYGCLYSWSVAMAIDTSYNNTLWNGSDSLHQGFCPAGWHLPSDAEWQELENHLESDPDYIAIDERQHSGDVGYKIKADSGWLSQGNGSNESGFNAVGAGIRYRTGFYLNEGTYTYFWTATEAYPGSATYRYLRDSSQGTFRGFPHKENGLSVRCVRD